MNLFNKNEAIIYFEDRRCYVFKYGDKDGNGEIHSFDIPLNVVGDGHISDSAQLHYLLKKTLEENGLTKSKALFVVNSSLAVNRTMHVPSMTEKERASLIENESSSLFAQDLEDYVMDSVDLKSDDDVNHLLITIFPEEALEGYLDLAKKCELKLRGVIPFSTLCLEYAHWLGGGRINFVGTSHLGFYYGHENRYFDRTEVNDAVLDFMSRNELEAEDVLRIKDDNYDGRMSDVDRPNVMMDMQSAYYEALGHVEHMGGDFSLTDRQFIAGSFVESGLFEEMADEESYRPLLLSDIFSSAMDNPDATALFMRNKGSGGLSRNHYIPAAGLVLAFVILIGSFIYGEKLKQQNRDLIVTTHEREKAQEEEMPSMEDGELQNTVDVADAITKVKSSAPDTLIVTGMDYQGSILTIRGETNDANEVQTWCQQLEELLNVKVEEEPTATVADVVYFQLTAYLSGGEGDTSSEADSTEGNMNNLNASDTMSGDEADGDMGSI